MTLRVFKINIHIKPHCVCRAKFRYDSFDKPNLYNEYVRKRVKNPKRGVKPLKFSTCDSSLMVIKCIRANVKWIQIRMTVEKTMMKLNIF